MIQHATVHIRSILGTSTERCSSVDVQASAKSDAGGDISFVCICSLECCSSEQIVVWSEYRLTEPNHQWTDSDSTLSHSESAESGGSKSTINRIRGFVSPPDYHRLFGANASR